MPGAHGPAGNIDPTNKYAWAENVGWGNCRADERRGDDRITVHFNGTSGYLTGYAWGENIGWIKLGDDSGGPYHNNSATDWGVNLDAAGNLSGYAWGENVGWIKFDPNHSQVTMDMATGRFDGDAWGENIGWVRFQGSCPRLQRAHVGFRHADRWGRRTGGWICTTWRKTTTKETGAGLEGIRGGYGPDECGLVFPHRVDFQSAADHVLRVLPVLLETVLYPAIARQSAGR